AAHTIKGSAGLFGLDDVVSFTHIVENVLDRVRDNKIEINGDLLNIILPCRDHMPYWLSMHNKNATTILSALRRVRHYSQHCN
ncbi:Hpt domain-containing protein, partial [Enterobacter hormaechei]|uniref:Hpt domain-containing protein n=1 Tax=Enterobacter hormaechei TaxID=158836 RepID=UPI0022F13734